MYRFALVLACLLASFSVWGAASEDEGLPANAAEPAAAANASNIEAKLRDLQAKFDKVTRSLSERIDELEARVESTNARLGELLAGGNGAGPTRASLRATVRLHVYVAGQGRAALTRMQSEMGHTVDLVGDDSASFEVPNVGQLRYRYAGDPSGFDRVLSWTPAQVVQGRDGVPTVELALPLQ